MSYLLLVDDDPGILQMMKEPLEEAGFEVICAKDGQEALDLFQKYDFKVVFTDMNLPKANGLDVTLEFKKLKPEVSVVLMTGDPDSDILQLEVSKHVGANLSLSKPLDPIRLVDFIKTSQHPPPTPDGVKRSVLVVDDDEDIREFLCYSLKEDHWHTYEAENGKVAWEMYQKYSPEIVITDIYMPEMDGLELIMKLRQHNPDLPIITISGASTHSLEAAILLGIEEAFTKPFDPDEVVNCLIKLNEDKSA